MTDDLMLELITHGSGLFSNLAPLLHENSKLWPHQKLSHRSPTQERSLSAHEQLAKETPGIILSPSLSRDDSSTPREPSHTAGLKNDSQKPVSLETVGSLLIKSVAMPYQQTVDIKPFEPLDFRCYLLAWRVADLRPGSYFYWPLAPKLIPVRNLEGDFVEDRVAMDPTRLRGSSGLIVICGMVRYDGLEGGERYYRDLLTGAGYLAHNIVRNADSIGLSAATVVQFLDDPLALELGVDPAFEQPLAVIAFSSSPYRQIGDGNG